MGKTKILNALASNGSPPPEFETDPERHYLIVTIRQHEGFKAYNKESAQNNERTLSELLDTKDYEKLSPIIHHLEGNDYIKPYEAEVLLKKSPATVRRYLGKLVETKMVEKHGKANNTTWVCT